MVPHGCQTDPSGLHVLQQRLSTYQPLKRLLMGLLQTAQFQFNNKAFIAWSIHRISTVCQGFYALQPMFSDLYSFSRRRSSTNYSYGIRSWHDRICEKSSISCLSCWSWQPPLKVTAPYDFSSSTSPFSWWRWPSTLWREDTQRHLKVTTPNFLCCYPANTTLITDLVIYSIYVKQLHVGVNSTLTALR